MLKKLWITFLESLKSEERDYTILSIDKAIFLLAIPMIGEMLMESLFSVVDMYFVGQISTNAVAAVGLTESYLMIIFSLGIGISMAATAVVSRRIGEKNPRDAGKSTVQAIYITILCSTIIAIFGILYSPELLEIMGASKEVVAEGSGYTQIMLGGNLTIILLFMINGAFRGAGNATIAMKSLWIGNAVNMLLDPFLIFGWWFFPDLGIEGAAWASVIGRGIGVAYQIYYLTNKKTTLQIQASDFKIDWSTIKNISKIAQGGIGQYLISSASWIFVFRIIAEFGTQSLSAWTIVLRIIMFAILPAWGLANAAATLVGQNLGAAMPERSEKSVWRAAYFNTYFMIILTVVFIFFANNFIALFSTDKEVIEIGTAALIWLSSGYIFFGYGMVVIQAFNGAGDTRTPTILNIIGYWLIQIPLAYLLSIHFNLGMLGMYITIIVVSFVLAFISIILFKQGKWKKMVI
jgi:putative MATE family efflux protein